MSVGLASLVAVEKADGERVAVLEAEDDAPVGTQHRHRPEAGEAFAVTPA